MRAYLPKYNLTTAKSLEHALQMMNDSKRPIAGGTDLMVLFDMGNLPPGDYVNIHRIPDLQGIEVNDDYVEIGALTTYSQLRQHEIIQQEFPCICEAAKVTGGVAIQNRGTIGGNIANASPAADTPPALLVYDADLKIVSATGEKIVAYENFHTGYKQMQLAKNELIQRIRLPRKNKHNLHYYRKVGTRKAQAISKLCMAGVANFTPEKIVQIKIALASVAPTVIRCKKTEAYFCEKQYAQIDICEAKRILQTEIAAIDDLRSTKEYRIQVACNLIQEFFDLITEENNE
ncbi:FAD binding domain-containing protein [Candidatus Uabimicrobium amorphum]|uniref:Molybdopterin dehydrogenase n=1 Tax=Uabimicrobium amorphum TaxID=2596890 RepID=A0A5S9IKN8_UABAM|nr:xanthine dehydrogenase family protein subunit M [Candidatus Uabimicrobium amorphum]BBM83633.1 molybdopterin dehydrogenase [Candidatus Uabimicrobium amorphum]